MFSGIDGRFGWKPIPSEARVTRDEVSGFIEHIVTAVWKTVPPHDQASAVNPINPCSKKNSVVNEHGLNGLNG